MKRPTKTPCIYRGWKIEGEGGFMVHHFWAEKGDIAFGGLRLKELLDDIDKIEAGSRLNDIEYWNIKSKPLYF